MTNQMPSLRTRVARALAWPSCLSASSTPRHVGGDRKGAGLAMSASATGSVVGALDPHLSGQRREKPGVRGGAASPSQTANVQLNLTELRVVLSAPSE